MSLDKIIKIQEKAKKQRQNRLLMPFKEFAILMPVMQESTLTSLKRLVPPSKVADKEIPQDLQRVSYGTLCELQDCGNEADNYVDAACAICKVLTGHDKATILKAKAIEVIGAVSMVEREMQRIGKLFADIASNDDAAKSGLDFGAFGIADWYAQRMGITNHDEAFATPWARIYQCLKNDREVAEWERRYREQQINEAKRRK